MTKIVETGKKIDEGAIDEKLAIPDSQFLHSLRCSTGTGLHFSGLRSEPLLGRLVHFVVGIARQRGWNRCSVTQRHLRLWDPVRFHGRPHRLCQRLALSGWRDSRALTESMRG